MKKVNIKVCVNLQNMEKNCVVFWKNLHSWQKFYTTAGRDKFQVCNKHKNSLLTFFSCPTTLFIFPPPISDQHQWHQIYLNLWFKTRFFSPGTSDLLPGPSWFLSSGQQPFSLGTESKNQNGNLRWHLPWRGGGSRGGLECHIPILKNDFFKNHLESFPDCENVFCT